MQGLSVKHLEALGGNRSLLRSIYLSVSQSAIGASLAQRLVKEELLFLLHDFCIPVPLRRSHSDEELEMTMNRALSRNF